jgi:hypothetical protein
MSPLISIHKSAVSPSQITLQHNLFISSKSLTGKIKTAKVLLLIKIQPYAALP